MRVEVVVRSLQCNRDIDFKQGLSEGVMLFDEAQIHVSDSGFGRIESV